MTKLQVGDRVVHRIFKEKGTLTAIRFGEHCYSIKWDGVDKIINTHSPKFVSKYQEPNDILKELL